MVGYLYPLGFGGICEIAVSTLDNVRIIYTLHNACMHRVGLLTYAAVIGG